MNTSLVFIALVPIILLSLVGALSCIGSLRRYIERRMAYFVSFSSGVFAFLLYHLAFEAYEELGLMYASIGAIVGAIFLSIIVRVVPEAEHHHEPGDDHTHSHMSANRILLSDSFHNVGDGIILVSAFAAGIPAGFAALVGVMAHEAAQEMSEFFALRESGLTIRQTLFRNFISSLSIIIGVAIGLYAADIHIEPYVSALAAGALLVVIIKDFGPRMVHRVKKRGFIYHGAIFALGALLMVALSVVFPAVGH